MTRVPVDPFAVTPVWRRGVLDGLGGTNTLAKANKWTGHNVTVVQRTNTQPLDLQVYLFTPPGSPWVRGRTGQQPPQKPRRQGGVCAKGGSDTGQEVGVGQGAGSGRVTGWSCFLPASSQPL